MSNSNHVDQIGKRLKELVISTNCGGTYHRNLKRDSAQSLGARVGVYLIKVEFLRAAIGGVDFDRVFIRRLNDGKVSPA